MEKTTEFVILKANAYARFDNWCREIVREEISKQKINLIKFDGKTACLWIDECLIVECNEYFTHKEHYQSEVVRNAKRVLYRRLKRILKRIEYAYTLEGEERILVETPNAKRNR